MSTAASTSATATTTLADEITTFLEREGPSSCNAISSGISRLRMTVRHTLLKDDRFVRTGQGRATRWHMRGETGSGTGYPVTNGAGGTPESPSKVWSWERLSSLCTDPELHRSWRAHWTDEAGRDWCVRCDPEGPPPVPLTFREWMRGEGSEKARECFEQDVSDMFSDRGASPEALERVRFGMRENDFDGEESDDVDD